MMSDHPRACGANRGTGRGSGTYIGSSPRVRGKLHGELELESRRRIIPARAGQTPGGADRDGVPTDHPRACGANVLACVPVGDTIGSSPRVRGKRAHDDHAIIDPRIIPARAGQTGGFVHPCLRRADHPRACGANGRVRTAAYAPTGSSPRVRGKRAGFYVAGDEDRIIPARAGQTTLMPNISAQTTDHPRACGANTFAGQWRGYADGSSPRVRGKLMPAILRWH